MYAARIAETVEVAQVSAYGRAVQDRERYRRVLEHVEKYANEHKRVLGGRPATIMLQGVPASGIPLDAYRLVLYTPEPHKDAGVLAKQIYALDPGGLTQYTVMVPREGAGGAAGASLSVGQREVVQVKGLPSFRGVHLYDIITPEVRAGLFTGAPTPCLGPEVQLLETYAALCDPSRAGEWGERLEEEAALRAVFLKNFERRVGRAIKGGAPGARGAPGAGGVERQLQDLRKALVERFLNREGRVWLVAPASKEAKRRPACASVYPLDKEQAYLAELAEKAGARVHFLDNDPQLLGDPRLRRLTMYFKRGTELREPVLDVFNVPTYEALPYLHRTEDFFGNSRAYKLATAFGRARFLLVDVWTVQLLWKMKTIAEAYALQRLQELVERYRVLSEQFSDPEEAFPALPSHFLGRIEDPALAEKRRAYGQPRAAPAGRAAARGDRRNPGGAKNKWRPIPFYPVRNAAPNATGPNAAP